MSTAVTTPLAPTSGAQSRSSSSAWLGAILERISNPRKHRWNAYMRACKAIPKGSPVAGSTSFRKINLRRHDLINAAVEAGRENDLDSSPEYRAIEKAVGAWLAGPTVASTFRMSRELRRLERLHSPNK